jgi:hypothetical protein
MRELYASDLPALGEQADGESRKSSDTAAENPGKNLRLALVGALVDEDATGSLDLSRPQITLPLGEPRVRIPVPFKAVIGWSAL